MGDVSCESEEIFFLYFCCTSLAERSFVAQRAYNETRARDEHPFDESIVFFLHTNECCRFPVDVAVVLR